MNLDVERFGAGQRIFVLIRRDHNAAANRVLAGVENEPLGAIGAAGENFLRILPASCDETQTSSGESRY